jgi:hypothetical protein
MQSSDLYAWFTKRDPAGRPGIISLLLIFKLRTMHRRLAEQSCKKEIIMFAAS